jgi:hypothetical protein
MKKTLFYFLTTIVVATGCQKSSLTEMPLTGNENINNTEEAPIFRQCASYEVLQQQMASDPGLASRMQAIEDFTTRFEKNPSMNRLVNGVIEIPVVVNVLYKTAAQNISDAQIASQIAVLNADFAATNSDISLTPSTFTSVLSGNTNIRFVLSKVNRKSTTKTSWSTNDAVKKTTKSRKTRKTRKNRKPHSETRYNLETAEPSIDTFPINPNEKIIYFLIFFILVFPNHT